MSIETLEDTIEATKDLDETNQEDQVSDCCCPSCTPEVVDVTVNNNTYSFSGYSFTLTNTQDSATQVTVLLQMVDEDGAAVTGHFRIKLWFVDTPYEDADKSVSVPATPGDDEWEEVTDDDGQISTVVAHTGSTDTWYLCADLGTGIVISDAITIGT